MNIGVPREIMDNEYRVGLVPSGVRTLVTAGHKVYVEQSAGTGCGISDEDFADAGGQIVATAREVFQRAEMIIKVKDPQKEEFDSFQSGQILYTFLHLAPNEALTDFLCQKKISGIAYETIQLDDGSIPILAPMSEVAGRMSIQIGAHFLEKQSGGAGVLLGGVPGVEPGRITIIGAGTVGSNAVRIAQAMGARVTVLDLDMQRLEHLDELYSGRIKTLVSNGHNIENEVRNSDLVIGAVLIPGTKAPRLVTKEMVKGMRTGTVIVDVAIDQGGCVETAKVTTHSEPIYEVEGVIHYCVANIPGAVPHTSAFALTNASLPYALAIANKGLGGALNNNKPLQRGLNVHDGKIICQEVAQSQGKEWHDVFHL